jgi:hypothetical protein
MTIPEVLFSKGGCGDTHALDRTRARRPRVTAPRKLYKIGEVMQYSGLSRQTVHNYTVLELITEVERTASGHRLYGEEVFERIKRIEQLKKQNTIAQVLEILRREDAASGA